MSIQNSSDSSDSASAAQTVYQPVWERLPDALQRVMDSNGISKDDAQGAIRKAIADGSIRIRCCLETHATRAMTSNAVLDGSAFQIPPGLESHHLDWDRSRPTKTWVV